MDGILALVLWLVAAHVLPGIHLRDLGGGCTMISSLPLGESGAKIDVNNQLDPSPVRWERK